MSCFPDVWAPTVLSYVTACLSIILGLVAILGNSLICLAVIIDPFHRFRTPFIYFLVNLALSDLIYGLVPMVISVVIHFKEADVQLAIFEAQTLHMAYFICVTASVTSIAFLLLDRYLAITWPIKYREKLSLNRCVVMSIGIWVFSIAISFLYFKLGYITYLMLFVHTSVAITTTIAIFCYLRVYKILTRPRNSPTHKINDRLRMLREKYTTRAFMWILLVNIILYTPAIIMIYILHFCETCPCSVRHVLRDLQFLIISSNASINPFVCAIRMKAFRDTIFALPKKCCRKKPKVPNPVTLTIQQSPSPTLTERVSVLPLNIPSIVIQRKLSRQNAIDDSF